MECFKVGFGWGGRRGRHVAFVFLRVEGGWEEMVEAVKQWGCCRKRVWGINWFCFLGCVGLGMADEGRRGWGL